MLYIEEILRLQMVSQENAYQTALKILMRRINELLKENPQRGKKNMSSED